MLNNFCFLHQFTQTSFFLLILPYYFFIYTIKHFLNSNFFLDYTGIWKLLYNIYSYAKYTFADNVGAENQNEVCYLYYHVERWKPETPHSETHDIGSLLVYMTQIRSRSRILKEIRNSKNNFIRETPQQVWTRSTCVSLNL